MRLFRTTLQRTGSLGFDKLVLPAIAILGTLLLLAACEAGGAGDTGVPSPAHMEGVPLGDPSIGGWATGVVAYEPGEEATAYTDPSQALGPASGVSTEVLVLGRGGSVTLSFDGEISDGAGAELALFENGLGTTDALFGELAYVELSSNGIDFVRFPVRTERTEPITAYERFDTRDYVGFAGLHPAGTGTAFDFSEVATEPEVLAGTVDLASIRVVRIVDVVGDGSQTDVAGNPIYDPYPTTGSAGFDLDGVALLRSGQ